MIQRRVGAAILGGAVCALSLPPWGWWPLGLVGTALLAWSLEGLRARWRLLAGMGFGLGLFVPGLWWMGEFHVAGAMVVMAVEAALLALAALLAPPGRWRAAGGPAALGVVEAARRVVRVGGGAPAGSGLGQAAGPLAGPARVGGELLVVGLAAVVGGGLVLLARRRWLAASLALGTAVVAAMVGAVSPDGGGGPDVATAVVQGGGRRGDRAVESDAQDVLDAQLAASTDLRPPLALVLWPEDVVDVDVPIAEAPEAGAVADVARRTGSTLVAGITEAAGPRRFRNAAVAWSPQGQVVGRYDKVKRVPYGEYVPARALVERLGDVSAIPRDALPGRGPGLLVTPAGPVGVTISYEVFFPARARAATRAGARLLTVPTNAASYSTSQVPTQELAAARLRAIESGRDLLQAAPTGYSAYLDNRGRVLARSTLGRRQVIQRTATTRNGRTVYVAVGDGPVLALAGAVLAGGWLARGRLARRRVPVSAPRTA